jgi:hypothetical protein
MVLPCGGADSSYSIGGEHPKILRVQGSRSQNVVNFFDQVIRVWFFVTFVSIDVESVELDVWVVSPSQVLEPLVIGALSLSTSLRAVSGYVSYFVALIALYIQVVNRDLSLWSSCATELSKPNIHFSQLLGEGVHGGWNCWWGHGWYCSYCGRR